MSPESLKAEEVQRFIHAHAGVLDRAVDAALHKEPMDDVSIQRLKESNYVFSGIKVFHELNEAFPSLLDEEGTPKPFERFLNDVQKVHESYNVDYLRTEYNFAHASALMAARWKKFERDGELYLLQYRTIGDDRVRRTHRMLHNITLPVTSPFWDKYFPPNGWNCRCTVVQVRKGKNPVSDEREAMNLGSRATAGKYQEMFMFNPGKRMATFPAYNAYTIRKCNSCQWRPDKMKLAADIPDNELCQACRLLQEMTDRKQRMKERRKEIQREASGLKEKPVVNPEFGKNIQVTGKAIKEWLNQPHRYYVAKNEMLLNIHEVMRKARYKGSLPDKHDANITAHIFETTVADCKSWIIVREFTDGQINLYSITDSGTLVEKIKK